MTNISKQRLLSLDTLRGFDMFWIIGGDILFKALGQQTNWSWADALARNMDHATWEGFYGFDLIFPLFMFISGVAIPYALFSQLEKGVTTKALYPKILKRACILIILGMVYNGGLNFDFENLRIASVLGQIGLAYLIAALIAIHFRKCNAIVFWIIGILIGYAILQLVVPVPEYGAGILTPEGSINSYIDRMLLPGKLYGTVFDPEGLLCIVSAAAITLMGTLAGLILRSDHFTPYKKVLLFVITGLGLIIIALVLNNWYPIIKSIWTSTFNLLTGGISFVLLAIFYLIIDVWNYQKWTFFFRVIGLNSIAIYMAVAMVHFQATSDFLFSGFASFFGDFKLVILALGLIIIEWLFLYFLYKKNIFIKI
ncbi:DUF5009 domain-containing protein [Flavobacterium jejuense]|uniref:DUF5009 domain-containing protein n=1 Tax=Flavobacterium jejuense TaxID=1544455 RepID=A0ABX0IWM5_9FLAO|nr:DUF5009 domain-containing protein [Flavobacterium jejuense]NHN26923.1 DUF5009 domain-containing protein [Flavobacterium jejuense]